MYAIREREEEGTRCDGMDGWGDEGYDKAGRDMVCSACRGHDLQWMAPRNVSESPLSVSHRLTVKVSKERRDGTVVRAALARYLRLPRSSRIRVARCQSGANLWLARSSGAGLCCLKPTRLPDSPSVLQ